VEQELKTAERAAGQTSGHGATKHLRDKHAAAGPGGFLGKG
jgi:hypothetical protein